MARVLWLLMGWMALGPLPALAQAGATVRGHIAGGAPDSVVLSWRSSPLDAREQRRSSWPDPQGGFVFRLPLAGATLFQVSCGSAETPLFVEPGDTLRLEIVVSREGDKFRFEAGGAAPSAALANAYLAEANARFADNEGYQVLPDNIQLYEAPFVSFLDYRRTKQLKFLRQSHPERFTPAFRAFAEAEIRYAHANDRLDYPVLREQVVGGAGRNQTLSTGFYNFLGDANLLPGNEAAASSPQYLEFLLGYAHHQAEAAGHPAGTAGFFPAAFGAAGRMLHGAMRPVVQGLLLRECFRHGHVAQSQALLDDYAAHALAPPAWVTLLRQDLDALRPLAIGSPAPALPIGLTTLTGDTLRWPALAGRLVYLLWWDTQQPSSQRERPFLAELHEALAGQPIVFVTLGLDADEAAWRRRMLTLPVPPGYHVYVPRPQQAALRQAYDLTTLPAAVLLAADGALLDPHARRPSSRALRDDLRAAQGRAAAYRNAASSPPPRTPAH